MFFYGAAQIGGVFEAKSRENRAQKRSQKRHFVYTCAYESHLFCVNFVRQAGFVARVSLSAGRAQVVRRWRVGAAWGFVACVLSFKLPRLHRDSRYCCMSFFNEICRPLPCFKLMGQVGYFKQKRLFFFFFFGEKHRTSHIDWNHGGGVAFSTNSDFRHLAH